MYDKLLGNSLSEKAKTKITSVISLNELADSSFDEFGEKVGETLNYTESELLYGEAEVASQYESVESLKRRVRANPQLSQAHSLDIQSRESQATEKSFHCKNRAADGTNKGDEDRLLERDYGHRYYQPWPGRGLSADPAGTVDGLNLYCMSLNNPISDLDKNGDTTSKAVISVEKFRRRQAQEKTLDIAFMSGMLERFKAHFSEGQPRREKLKDLAAHAAILYEINGRLEFKDEFVNIKTEKYFSQKNAHTFKKVIKNIDNNSYQIDKNSNDDNFVEKHLIDFHPSIAGFFKAIHGEYKKAGKKLNDIVGAAILNYLKQYSERISIQAGIPGLHAEVLALNDALNEGANYNKIESIFVHRLSKSRENQVGDAFPACENCTFIIKQISDVNIDTGITHIEGITNTEENKHPAFYKSLVAANVLMRTKGGKAIISFRYALAVKCIKAIIRNKLPEMRNKLPEMSSSISQSL